MEVSILDVLSRGVQQVTNSNYINSILAFLTQLALFLLFVTVIYYLIHIGNRYLDDKKRIIIGRRHVMNTVLILLGLVAAILFLSIWSNLSGIFTPFIASIVFAYILNPLVKMLQRRGLKRLWAILVLYLGIAVLITGFTMTVIPQIGREIGVLLEMLPDFSQQVYGYINNFYAFVNENLQNLPPELDGIKNLPSINMNWIQQVVINTLTSITNGLLNTFSSIFDFVLIPVLTFYFLKDAELFQRSFMLIIPTRSRKKILEMFKEFDQVLGGFVRGQLIVALLIAILMIISLLILDVRFAVILGIIAGLCDVIPFIGPIIGAVPAVIFALMDSPIKALWVVIAVVIIQQVESNILSPKIVGDSVGLHPVVIVLALLIGGSYMGLLGMVFAVPVTAVIKILGKYAIRYVSEFK